MTEKRFHMNKSGDLYDKNNLLMLNFGYSYDGVGCKRIIDLLNELNDENKQLKLKIQEECNFTLGKEWNCEGKMVELLHNGEIIGYVFKNNLNELADPTRICNHLNKICTENQQNGRNIRY